MLRWSHTKPLLHQLHWLPVQQRITYKLAVLMYKVQITSTLVHLHCRIAERACSKTLHAISLLDQPFMRTVFSTICLVLSTTHSSHQWFSVLNPDLKLFCSVRLLLNTDPTCHQRLLSYDYMALQKFSYYYYYYQPTFIPTWPFRSPPTTMLPVTLSILSQKQSFFSTFLPIWGAYAQMQVTNQDVQTHNVFNSFTLFISTTLSIHLPEISNPTPCYHVYNPARRISEMWTFENKKS